VYQEVYAVPAHQLPAHLENFASAFANCSLEHMDHLPEVMSSIRGSLKPGGYFLLSVVTDKFLEWATLPLLVREVGDPTHAQNVEAEYQAYHHLVNPLPVMLWMEHLERAGFKVLEHVPIVPELTSRLFLFLDHLWHIRRPGGELGDVLFSYMGSLPNFLPAFRQILANVLHMERDWSTGSGAVFWARRKE
jgi:SAM-dependent methyltransferase